MSLEPTTTESKNDRIFRLLLEDAADRGRLLMRQLVFAAVKAIQSRERASGSETDRARDAKSVQLLRDWEGRLCRSYPDILIAAFASAKLAEESGGKSHKVLDFSSLELMDEAQVQAHVVMAHTQQQAELTAQSNLNVLDGLVCSVMGMRMVRPEKNPLRPQIFVEALITALAGTGQPGAMRLDWMSHMGSALGWELAAIYAQLANSLRRQGVVPATYVIGPGVERTGGVGRGVGQDYGRYLSQEDPVLSQFKEGTVQSGTAVRPANTTLTLDKLRRLLSGELGIPIPLSPKEQFAEKFAKEYEADRPTAWEVPSHFAPTVPAALEALREMDQVEEVAQRLRERNVSMASQENSNEGAEESMRSQMRLNARNAGQLLGLEVVTLVLENLVSDTRLLPPIRRLLQRLERVYLQLALVDSRLFTDRKHPARLLFQEITQRSLAYASVVSPGFAEFLSEIESALVPLLATEVESAEPFQVALHLVQDQWREVDQVSERAQLSAVTALQQVEKRNLLATTIAQEIASHPEALEVPALSMNFLSGPWAQVVAQARLEGKSLAADKYEALIASLMRSSRPVAPGQDAKKLLRVLPRIMGTLHEGLETIRYPTAQTAAFIESLLGLHQHLFRKKVPLKEVEDSLTSPRAEDDPWVAPSEAHASNYMELSEAAPYQGGEEGGLDVSTETQATDAASLEASRLQTLERLVVGTWVEVLIGEKWHRTQLTWISPRQTLFLFTSSSGQTRSMSKRLRDKIVAAGQLRIISSEPVLDQALNAVAEMAMRNSFNEIS